MKYCQNGQNFWNDCSNVIKDKSPSKRHLINLVHPILCKTFFLFILLVLSILPGLPNAQCNQAIFSNNVASEKRLFMKITKLKLNIHFTHVKLPSVLVQFALELQLSTPYEHSSTSTQVTPSPVYPA